MATFRFDGGRDRGEEGKLIYVQYVSSRLETQFLLHGVLTMTTCSNYGDHQHLLGGGGGGSIKQT